MTKPPPNPDETLRLQALHSLKVLDTQPEVRFDRITRLARRIFSVEVAIVRLIDVDRHWFKNGGGLEVSPDMSFCDHVVAQDHSMVVTDTLADERFKTNPLVTDDPFIRFYAGWPIHDGNRQVLGTLCIVDSEPREFSQEDAEIFAELASMVEEEFSSFAMATSDQLTGLANRRGFLRTAEHLLPLLGRMQVPLALVAIDLDGLKTINDTEGHQAGDELIKEFAKLLLKTYRQSDVVARPGGDEFCVLASGAEAKHAPLLIGKLRDACRRKAGRTIEFSAGVATYDADKHAGVQELCDQADVQMYKNKQARRSNTANMKVLPKESA